MIIVKLNGGFCNNLFQYSAAKSLANRTGDELKLDIEFFKESVYKDIYRFNYLNITENIATTNEIYEFNNKEPKGIIGKIIKKAKIPSIYNKSSHFIEKNIDGAIDKRIFELKGNVYLDGWFADEDYFKDIRALLLKEFELKNELRTESENVLNKILNSNSVSIHIRRGAFVENTYFGALPVEYYYRAVSYIKSKLINPHFFVFSDDIEWVRKHLSIDGETTIVHHNSSKASFHHTQYDYEDLTLMKNCKHNIMAHSTFSWWAAWLNQNPNKIVVAPTKALNDIKAQKIYEKSNYILSNWTKL